MNPFSLTFGKEPKSMIERDKQTSEIVEGFRSENPEFQVCMITGVRGSGKTVMLTAVSNELRKEKDWIVIELSPERDLLRALAADLSNRTELLQIFRDAKINLSFLGFGIEIDGVPPVTDTVTALDRMLAQLSKKGKKLLVTIDETVCNRQIREFASQFQIFLRRDYNIFLLMTGLYENIYDIQNEKTLTFLYRAPKIELSPLNRILVAKKYKSELGLDDASADEMADIVKGYPYAFQVLGYLCYKRGLPYKSVMDEFDAYLEEYVYDKIWSELSLADRKLLASMAECESTDVADIRRIRGISSSEFSVYRKRLMKKGIAVSNRYGTLDFSLPRFREFVNNQTV